MVPSSGGSRTLKQNAKIMNQITNSQLQDYLKLITPFVIDCQELEQLDANTYKYHFDKSFGHLVYFNSNILITVSSVPSIPYIEHGHMRFDPPETTFIMTFEFSNLWLDAYEMLNDDQILIMEKYLESIIEIV